MKQSRYRYKGKDHSHYFVDGGLYDNVPLKQDCVSPIVQDLDIMKYFLNPASKMITVLSPSSYSKLEYSSVVEGVDVKHDYYAENINGYFWLVYPQDYYSHNWPSIETKYFHIIYHYNLESYLNPISLEQADKFIETMAVDLHLSDDDLKLIEEKKITYFYCDTDETVREITGHLIKGTYDMASDDIISAFFPHYHELAHFLINFKLQKLPLYTLPIMREGIAVNYGGRWGKATSALLPMTIYLYKENFIDLDSILTFYGFEKNAGSDIAYLVAGLFNSFLTDKIGTEKYLQLYLNLSNQAGVLKALTSDDIKEIIISATGHTDWNNFKTDFDIYMDKLTENNINVRPGQLTDGKKIYHEDKFTIFENDQWIGVECRSLSYETPRGNILFGMENSLLRKNSALLNEHHKGLQPFEGYRWGIRYDKNEIGLYDYATNYLLAKYIWGITPSEEYYNEQENKIYIMFKKEIAGSILNNQNFKVLPE